MNKKNKANKMKPNNVEKVIGLSETEKDKTLIFSGVILAISSIGLLIFVLSEKIFNLS